MMTIAVPPTLPAKAVTACVAALRNLGGVILLPTETVYGLACRWADAVGLERLRQIKGRESGKPLPMLVPDLKTALAAGLDDTPALRQLVARLCPGPLTIVQTVKGGGTLGFRIPDHPFVLALLRALREPLAASSANLSGEPPTVTFAAAMARLVSAPDLGVDTGRIAATALASTVVDLSVSPWRILRAGPISADAIRTALAK